MPGNFGPKTTDDPGRPLTKDEEKEVAAGRLDFQNGRWIESNTGSVRDARK